MNAGELNGLSLLLNISGTGYNVTTEVNAAYEAMLEGYYGMIVYGEEPGWGYSAHYVTPHGTFIYAEDEDNVLLASIGRGYTSGAGIVSVSTSSSPQETMNMVPWAITHTAPGGTAVQIAGPRQTGVGSPSGFADSVAQAYIQKLHNALAACGCIS